MGNGQWGRAERRALVRGVWPRQWAIGNGQWRRPVLLALTAVMLGGCESEPEPVFTPYRSTTPAPVVTPGVRSSDAFVISRDPWTFQDAKGEVIETPHYRILTTIRPGLLAERLPGFLEGAIASYTAALGTLPLPDEKLETYVMATRPQWVRLTQMLMRDRADVYLRIQRGGYAADGRGIYFDIGIQDTLAISAHEGWHQYTQTTFKERLPIWLEEGVAAYMEGYRWDSLQNRAVFLGWSNVERYDALRRAREDGTLMPLETLLSSEPSALIDRAGDSALTYYAQVWAMVHWLREGEGGRYRPALASASSASSAGRMNGTVRGKMGPESMGVRRLRSVSTFQAYFERDLLGASTRYQAFVDSITGPGSKDQIVAGRSPLRR